jgi:hypothetical protein
MRRVLLAAVIASVAPATASAAPLGHGTTKITFDAAFGLKLVKQGVDATPVAPATQDSLTFSLGVTGGRVHGRRATIRHAGGFHMKDAADGTEIEMRDLVLRVKGRRVRLSGLAAINNITYDSFAFAVGTARTVRRTKSGVTVRHIDLRLNGISAAALNSQFGTTEFAAGQTLGSGTVRAHR